MSRILFVATEDPFPPRNGVTTKSAGLVDGLRSMGSVVDLIRAPSFSTGSIHDRWVRVGRADVVHFDTLNALRDASLVIALVRRRRRIWSINDSLVRRAYPGHSQSRGKRAVAALLEFVATSVFHEVHLVAEHEAARVRSRTLVPSRVKVIPLGVPNYHQGTDPDHGGDVAVRRDDRLRRVGIMSSLTGVLGQSVREFCEVSWPLIRRSCPALELEIVGAADSRPSWLPADSGIVWRAWVDSPQDFLRYVDVTVAPYPVPMGVPNKALQSLRSGVPALGLGSLAGLLETYHEAAAGVSLHASPVELARAIVALAREPDRFRTLKAGAIRAGRRLPAWDHVAALYMAESGLS